MSLQKKQIHNIINYIVTVILSTKHWTQFPRTGMMKWVTPVQNNTHHIWEDIHHCIIAKQIDKVTPPID